MNGTHKIVWCLILMLSACTTQSTPKPSFYPTSTFTQKYSPSLTPSKSRSATLSPSLTNTAGIPSYRAQIHITTTSDWTTFRLVSGGVLIDKTVLSASAEATRAEFSGDRFFLSQPIAQAQAGKTIEMVADLSIGHIAADGTLIIEIDRGYLGSTQVRISNYLCAGPSLVETLTWGGIKSAGHNTQSFEVPAREIVQPGPNKYIVIAQLNFWYYGPGCYGGFEKGDCSGIRSTPLTPRLGFTYKAADPAVVYQQIEWAVEYGVDAFSIEWTTPRGIGCCGSMEDTLDDVFLKSPNIGKIRWVIFYDFVLRLMQTPGLKDYARDLNFDQPDVYQTFVSDFGRFADKYFSNPQYLTIDARPVIYIWATNAFKGNLAGAIREAREQTLARGFDVFIVGDEINANSYNPSHASLFDGNTTFTFLIPGINRSSWRNVGDAVPAVDQTFTRWLQNIQGLRVQGRNDLVNFQPAWAPQYDDRLVVRENETSTYVPAENKDQVIMMATVARDHAQPVGSTGQSLIWLNTWNCWQETTTVEPTADLGPKYPAGNYQFDMLEVVREVFGVETYMCGSP
jgi:hypothetical protein